MSRSITEPRAPYDAAPLGMPPHRQTSELDQSTAPVLDQWPIGEAGRVLFTAEQRNEYQALGGEHAAIVRVPAVSIGTQRVMVRGNRRRGLAATMVEPLLQAVESASSSFTPLRLLTSISGPVNRAQLPQTHIAAHPHRLLVAVASRDGSSSEYTVRVFDTAQLSADDIAGGALNGSDGGNASSSYFASGGLPRGGASRTWASALEVSLSSVSSATAMDMTQGSRNTASSASKPIAVLQHALMTHVTALQWKRGSRAVLAVAADNGVFIWNMDLDVTTLAYPQSSTEDRNEGRITPLEDSACGSSKRPRAAFRGRGACVVYTYSSNPLVSRAPITSIAFSSNDARLLAMASIASPVITVVDVANSPLAQPVAQLTSIAAGTSALCFSQHDTWLACAALGEQRLRLYDPRITWRRHDAVLPGPCTDISACDSVSADHQRLACFVPRVGVVVIEAVGRDARLQSVVPVLRIHLNCPSSITRPKMAADLVGGGRRLVVPIAGGGLAVLSLSLPSGAFGVLHTHGAKKQNSHPADAEALADEEVDISESPPLLGHSRTRHAECDLIGVVSKEAVEGISGVAFHDTRDPAQPLSILVALDEARGLIYTTPMHYHRRRP